MQAAEETDSESETEDGNPGNFDENDTDEEVQEDDEPLPKKRTGRTR